MNTIEEIKEAQRQIASQLHKNKKAYITLTNKQAQTWQIKRVASNIENFQMMLKIMDDKLKEETWLSLNREELQLLLEYLPKYIAQIEMVKPKFMIGTPHHTLAMRRIEAFNVVERIIKEEFNTLMNV